MFLWEPKLGKEDTTFCSLYFYLRHDKPVHQDLCWLLIDFGSAVNLNGSQLKYPPAVAHYPFPLFCSVVVGNVPLLSENDLSTCGLGFFAGMSICSISNSLAVFKSLTVGRENEVSHLGEQGRIQKSALHQTEQD